MFVRGNYNNILVTPKIDLPVVHVVSVPVRCRPWPITANWVATYGISCSLFDFSTSRTLNHDFLKNRIKTKGTQKMSRGDMPLTRLEFRADDPFFF